MGSLTEQLKNYVRTKCGKGDLWLRAIDCLKGFGWNLHWSEVESNWHLLADQSTILVTPSWDALQDFVFGLLYSSLELAHLGLRNREKEKLLLTLAPPPKEQRQPSPASKVFYELQTVNDSLLVFEWRYMAPARSPLLYRAYQKKTYPSDLEEDFQEFGQLYERKLELERRFEALTANGVSSLLVGESEPRRFSVTAEDQLAVVFVFLTLYLGWHWPLHKINGRWHLWMGDQPHFIGESELEIRAFLYGLAYPYTSLPSKIIDRLRRRPWMGWQRAPGGSGRRGGDDHDE
jgi:hypothetical protein